MDITLQDSQEEFFSNLVEDEGQVPSYPFSFWRRFQHREPTVALIDLPRDQKTGHQTVDEPSDFAFVSSENNGDLSGVDSPGFHAEKKHARFLYGHPKSQEATVEGCLQLYTSLKQPGHQ